MEKYFQLTGANAIISLYYVIIALGNGVIEIVYRIFFFFWSNLFQFANVVFSPLPPPSLPVFRLEMNKTSESFVRVRYPPYPFFPHKRSPHSPANLRISTLLLNNSYSSFREIHRILEFSRFKVNFAQQKRPLGNWFSLL